MALHFACPRCRSEYTVPDRAAGKRSRCPRCGQVFQIPPPLTAPIIPEAFRCQEIIEDPIEDLAEVEPRPIRLRRPRWWPATPSFLGLAALLFFLPWVDVRCSSGKLDGKVLVRQSGLQAATGTCTLHPAFEAQRRRVESGKGESANAAPALALWPLLLSAAAVLAAVPIGRYLRPALVIPFAASALFAVIAQLVVGLPAAQAVHRFYERQGAGGGGGGDDLGTLLAMAVEVEYTPWLWLALLCAGAGIVTAGVETWLLATHVDFLDQG